MSKATNSDIDLQWIQQKTNYEKMSNQQLQDENKKIVNILKVMEMKLDKELDIQQKTINLADTAETHQNHQKVFSERIKNN